MKNLNIVERRRSTLIYDTASAFLSIVDIRYSVLKKYADAN